MAFYKIFLASFIWKYWQGQYFYSNPDCVCFNFLKSSLFTSSDNPTSPSLPFMSNLLIAVIRWISQTTPPSRRNPGASPLRYSTNCLTVWATFFTFRESPFNSHLNCCSTKILSRRAFSRGPLGYCADTSRIEKQTRIHSHAASADKNRTEKVTEMNL